MSNPYTSFPKHVTICEVGPRDGLQNEAQTIAAADKVRYIEMLVDAGITVIEATSFVSPAAVPQLADADEVFPAIQKRAGVRYITLVPNPRGLDRAIAAGVQEIAVFTAASESFAQRNIRMSIDASLATFGTVIARAKADGMKVRASVSTAFGCPFEGAVPVANVVRVAQALLDAGADTLSIADTIGVATPNQVIDVVSALLEAGIGLERFGLHFHDTRGTALANIMAGLQLGVHEYDASARAASAAVRSRPARPATSRPKTCSIFCTAWGSRPGSTSIACATRRASSTACSMGASSRAPSAPSKPPRARRD